jgi:hypothetical protein
MRYLEICLYDKPNFSQFLKKKWKNTTDESSIKCKLESSMRNLDAVVWFINCIICIGLVCHFQKLQKIAQDVLDTDQLLPLS